MRYERTFCSECKDYTVHCAVADGAELRCVRHMSVQARGALNLHTALDLTYRALEGRRA